MYDSPDELETIVCAFIAPVVREHQRLICALDTQVEARIIQHFRNIHLQNSTKTASAASAITNDDRQSSDENTTKNNRVTFDIDQLIQTGQVVFLHNEAAYLPDGEFDPDRMMHSIEQFVVDAKADGWRGIRTVGEMPRNCTTIDKIVRYENMLESLIATHDVLALCLYDRRQSEPSILLNVLTGHQATSIGIDLYENIYFVPQDDHANDFAGHPGATLNYWIRNLVERKRVDREIMKAKEEAQAESRAKSILLSTIFHDLRCPLIGIIGSIEMLRHFTQMQRGQTHQKGTENDTAKSLDRDFEDCFKTMQVCGDHLLQVVNGILDFSRARATNFDPTEFSLHTCVDDTFRVVESKALEKDIGISVVLDDVTGPYSDLANSGADTSPRSIARVVSSPTRPRKMIFTDEGALRKVLINVLGNAVKFTNRGGNIQVSVSARPFGPLEMAFVPPSTLLLLEQKLLSSRSYASTSAASSIAQNLGPIGRPTPSRVLFQIKDNGIGISPKDISRIFEAFQRVDDARDSSGQIVDGTGLGLSIVRTLANMMGGDVSVESPGIGHGSVFSVWIPAFFVEYDNVPCTTSDAAAGLRLENLAISNSLSTATTKAAAPTTPQQEQLSFHPNSTAPCTLPPKNPESASIGVFPCQKTPDIRNLKYLVCDDNKINFQIMTKFLNSYGCEDVTVCYNGQSAVDLVRQTVEYNEEGDGEDSPDDSDGYEAELSLNRSESTSEMDRLPPARLRARNKNGTADDAGERNEKKPKDQEVEETKSPPFRDESSGDEHYDSGGSSSITTGSSSTLYSASHSGLPSSSTDYVRTKTRRRRRTRRKPFDIIFVDYRMPPGINGAQTCQLIRSMIRESGNLSTPSLSPISSTCTPVFPPAPASAYPVHQPVIVCLTAAALEDESADCLANGIDETLLKPLKRDFLEKRLWDYARWLVVGRTNLETAKHEA